MHSLQHPSATANAFFETGTAAASSSRSGGGNRLNNNSQHQVLSSKRQSKVRQAAPSQQTAARGRAPQEMASAGAADSAAESSAGEAAPASGSSDNWRLSTPATYAHLLPSTSTPLTVEALKAHDRHTMPQLLKADNGVLLEITSWCDAPEILVLSAVCSRFRGTITFHDSFLFRPLCASLWSGRFISSPNLVPFAAMLAAAPSPSATNYHHQHQHHHQLPATPVMSPSGASPQRHSPSGHNGGSGDFPAVPHHHHHHSHSHHGQGHHHYYSHTQKIHSWREALVRSIAHSTKTKLTVEELSAANWQIKFLVDETIPAQPITFHSSTGTVRTDGFDPMRYQLYQQGGQLHVHVFPTQVVTRDPDTWQWVLHNPFVEISNTSHLPLLKRTTTNSSSNSAPVVAPTAATLPAPLPSLRPWFPTNCDSPSTYLGMGCNGGKLFSSCRDTDCHYLESSHCCSSSSNHGSSEGGEAEEVAEEESPLPNLKFRSKKKEKKDRKKFQQPTFTCCSIDGLQEGESLHFTLNLTDLDAEDVLRNAGTKVDGHGGDAEDPPSADFGDPPAAAACGGCDSSFSHSNGEEESATAGSTEQRKGNKRSGSSSPIGGEGKTQQQCATLLSSKSSVHTLLEKLFSQRDALWEQMGDLHTSQQRALWSDVPSRVEGHESEHLLDQGRPRKPP